MKRSDYTLSGVINVIFTISFLAIVGSLIVSVGYGPPYLDVIRICLLFLIGEYALRLKVLPKYFSFGSFLLVSWLTVGISCYARKLS